MAKKKEDRRKEQTQKGSPDCNLDGGYTSPIKSFSELSFENIKSLFLNSRYAQILLSLTVIGFILRFVNLGFNSLWLDEATTYGVSSNSFTGIWTTVASGEFNPPLFYWVEHVMLFFGHSEFILRCIPALLGVMTIPLFYMIGKEFLDRNVGIIAAALLAFSPFHIYYSQEARAYSMMLFFAALAVIFYLKALKENDTKNWILFGVFSALAFWSHFYVIVLIAALMFYALVIQVVQHREKLSNLKPFGMAILSFFVISLPLIAITIQLFITRTGSAPTFGVQGFSIIYETFSQMSGFGEIGFYLLMALFILGFAQIFLIDKTKGFFLVTVLLFTFIVSFLLSYRMPMMPRHLLFLLIIYFVVIGISYRIFYTLIRNRAIVPILVIVLIAINVPTLTTYYSGYSKDDWRGFSGQMQTLTHNGDKIILLPGYMSQPFDYYYSNRTDETYEYGAYTVPELNNITADQSNSTIFYIVTSDILAVNPKGDEIAWLKEHAKFAGQNGGIYLYTSG